MARNRFTVPTSDEQLLNVLGVSQRTVQRWSVDGTIDADFVDGRILIHDGYLNPNSAKVRELELSR